MAKYVFAKPTRGDAEYVACNLKNDNQLELLALIGDNALKEIIESLEHSEDIGCLYIDGLPAAVYGVRRINPLSDSGIAWLLMTEEVNKHKIFVGKATRNGIQAILGRYKKVYNWVNAENKDIIRWLKWLGATFSGPQPYGVYRKQHYYFEFRRN